MDTSQRHEEEPIITNNIPADCLESSQCTQQGWHMAQEAVPNSGRPAASTRSVATRLRPSGRERAGFTRVRDGNDDSESDQANNRRAMLWAMVMDVYRTFARAVYLVSKVVATLWCVFYTALSPLWFTFVQHFVFEFVKAPFTAMTIQSMAIVFGPPAVTITIGRVWPELAAQVVVGVIQFIMFQWCVIFLLVILIPFLESLGTVTWCVVLAVLFGVSLAVLVYERYRASRSVWESAFCCLARLPWGAARLRRGHYGYTLTPDVEMGVNPVSAGDVLWQRRGWLVMIRARARRVAVDRRGAIDGLGGRQLLLRCHVGDGRGLTRRPSGGSSPLWDLVARVVELEQPKLFAAIVRFL